MGQDIVIAMHKSKDFWGMLNYHLPSTVTVLEKKKVRMLQQEVRVNPVSCVILHADKNIPEEPHFERFKKGFPHVPCIAVLSSNNMELARHCGSMGIESVLSYDDIDCISDEIARVCALKSNTVSLSDLSINKTNVNYTTIGDF